MTGLINEQIKIIEQDKMQKDKRKKKPWDYDFDAVEKHLPRHKFVGKTAKQLEEQ